MSDTLVQKINQAVYAEPFSRLQRAIREVLKIHQHDLYDAYGRETSDLAAAKNGRCMSCRDQNGPLVWCPTVRGIAGALGVSEDPEEG